MRMQLNNQKFAGDHGSEVLREELNCELNSYLAYIDISVINNNVKVLMTMILFGDAITPLT
jgi:hypothetical protein